MKHSTKKILAREFIIAITVLCLACFGFLVTYPYNSYLRNKISTYEEETVKTNNIADSLNQTYNAKVFHDRDYISRVHLALSDYAYENLEAEPIFRKHILSDTTFRTKVFFCLKTNVDGFTKSKTEFDEALKIQLTNEDIENRDSAKAIEAQSLAINKEKEMTYKKLLSDNDQINFSIMTLAALAILVYVLRPLIYLFKWSVKTLKQQE